MRPNQLEAEIGRKKKTLNYRVAFGPGDTPELWRAIDFFPSVAYPVSSSSKELRAPLRLFHLQGGVKALMQPGHEGLNMRVIPGEAQTHYGSSLTDVLGQVAKERYSFPPHPKVNVNTFHRDIMALVERDWQNQLLSLAESKLGTQALLVAGNLAIFRSFEPTTPIEELVYKLGDLLNEAQLKYLGTRFADERRLLRGEFVTRWQGVDPEGEDLPLPGFKLLTKVFAPIAMAIAALSALPTKYDQQNTQPITSDRSAPNVFKAPDNLFGNSIPPPDTIQPAESNLEGERNFSAASLLKHGVIAKVNVSEGAMGLLTNESQGDFWKAELMTLADGKKVVDLVSEMAERLNEILPTGLADNSNKLEDLINEFKTVTREDPNLSLLGASFLLTQIGTILSSDKKRASAIIIFLTVIGMLSGCLPGIPTQVPAETQELPPPQVGVTPPNTPANTPVAPTPESTEENSFGLNGDSNEWPGTGINHVELVNSLLDQEIPVTPSREMTEEERENLENSEAKISELEAELKQRLKEGDSLELVISETGGWAFEIRSGRILKWSQITDENGNVIKWADHPNYIPAEPKKVEFNKIEAQLEEGERMELFIHEGTAIGIVVNENGEVTGVFNPLTGEVERITAQAVEPTQIQVVPTETPEAKFEGVLNTDYENMEVYPQVTMDDITSGRLAAAERVEIEKNNNQDGDAAGVSLYPDNYMGNSVFMDINMEQSYTYSKNLELSPWKYVFFYKLEIEGIPFWVGTIQVRNVDDTMGILHLGFDSRSQFHHDKDFMMRTFSMSRQPFFGWGFGDGGDCSGAWEGYQVLCGFLADQPQIAELMTEWGETGLMPQELEKTVLIGGSFPW